MTDEEREAADAEIDPDAMRSFNFANDIIARARREVLEGEDIAGMLISLAYAVGRILLIAGCPAPAFMAQMTSAMDDVSNDDIKKAGN